jgi:FkbM family methyltransferase
MAESLKYKFVKWLAKMVPNPVSSELINEASRKNKYSNSYFSQEGEEIILIRHFNYKTSGFFVDVGAHHPIRLSNTYKLYTQGWRGINIDAMPGSMTVFNQLRPLDINIEAAISDQSEELTYYKFNEGALNTFDKAKATHIKENTDYKCIGEVKIVTKTLKSILDEKLPEGTKIDFISIDAEGLDLQVLMSNDWNKYIPEVIIAETDNVDLVSMLGNETTKYLANKGYAPFAKTYKSVFYKLK